MYYINLQMEWWDNPLMAGPIRMGWAISIKSYLNWQLACIHDPDHQFNDGSVLYQARAWSKGPEPVPIFFTSMMKNRWCTVHTQLNILSIQYLLPSPVVWIIIWTYLLPFCHIETQLMDNTKHRKNRVRVTVFFPCLINSGGLFI
jgi:hypothetical protein